jgi:hypothetical protein
MKRYLLTIILLLVAVAIGVGVGTYLIPKIPRNAVQRIFTPGYSAVYLRTGEMYVGQLYMFPRMKLVNPYILQSVPASAESPSGGYQLSPLSQSLWAPNVIYLNPEQVVFYGPVGEGSKIWDALQPK